MIIEEDCNNTKAILAVDPSLPKCTHSPEGFYTKEDDDQCFPPHDEGCPERYHSHQDDESGGFIPDSVPCADDHIMAPNYSSCDSKEQVCQVHPELDECTTLPQPESKPLTN